jgi:hypothetical protein
VERLTGTGAHGRRAVLIAGVILQGVIVARVFGFTAYLRFENRSRLTETIEGYGVIWGTTCTVSRGLAFGPTSRPRRCA